jgi:hypothetical protein
MKVVSLSHTTRVPLGLEQAMRCFTPEGERDWVHGWDPRYPAGPVDGDGDAPDTVFTTHGTTWVVVERAEALVRYARVTPGESAGTVTVRCTPDGEATAVEVTYALTALAPAGEARLEELADGYPAHIDGWAREIAGRLLA